MRWHQQTQEHLTADILESEDNTAGTTQAAKSAVTQPLAVATIEACTYLQHCLSCWYYGSTWTAPVTSVGNAKDTGAWGQSLFPKREKEKLPLPPTFQTPVSISK